MRLTPGGQQLVIGALVAALGLAILWLVDRAGMLEDDAA